MSFFFTNFAAILGYCVSVRQNQIGKENKLWLNLSQQHRLLPVEMQSISSRERMLLLNLYRMKNMRHVNLLTN